MSAVPTSGPMQRVDPDAPGRAAGLPPRVTTVLAPETRPRPTVRDRQAFYELDRWSKYNDPLLVIGWLTVCGGFAMFCPPVAVILLGAGLVALAWMMGKGK